MKLIGGDETMQGLKTPRLCMRQWRETDAAAFAVKQQHVMVLFKAAHLFRKRRLGLVQHIGSARESALQGDMVKGADLGVAHV